MKDSKKSSTHVILIYKGLHTQYNVYLYYKVIQLTTHSFPTMLGFNNYFLYFILNYSETACLVQRMPTTVLQEPKMEANVNFNEIVIKHSYTIRLGKSKVHCVVWIDMNFSKPHKSKARSRSF
jgi:hypothetical protein